MENAPVIGVSGRSNTPGADPALWERYQKWLTEVNIPIRLKNPGVTGVDFYHIIEERPEYPSRIITIHFDSVKAVEDDRENPNLLALANDLSTWTSRRVLSALWSVRYVLRRGFRSKPVDTGVKEETKIENAPFMHIEAYHLPPEERDKYTRWMNDYAFNSFVPLFLRLPGLKGYDCYQSTSTKSVVQTREWEYPGFLSILYFDQKKSFDDYTKSPELLAFQKAIYNVFPNGLNLKWYVQYQLVKSWRK
jgi:hypothetical protein